MIICTSLRLVILPENLWFQLVLAHFAWYSAYRDQISRVMPQHDIYLKQFIVPCQFNCCCWPLRGNLSLYPHLLKGLFHVYLWFAVKGPDLSRCAELSCFFDDPEKRMLASCLSFLCAFLEQPEHRSSHYCWSLRGLLLACEDWLWASGLWTFFDLFF